MIKYIQFASLVVMGMLTFMLFMLNKSKRRKPWMRVYVRSNFLLMVGTLLISVHFLLQLVFGFRCMGAQQAATVNMLFFPLAGWVVNVSMLYLLCRQTLAVWKYVLGGAACLLVFFLLFLGSRLGGGWLVSSEAMRLLVKVSLGIYCLMLVAYNALELKELKRVRRALSNYYDAPQDSMIKWLRKSMILLMGGALITPFTLFSSDDRLLGASGIVMVFTLLYYVVCFICYGVDTDYLLNGSGEKPQNEAAEPSSDGPLDEEESEENDSSRLTGEETKRIEAVVQQWVDEERFLHRRVMLPLAAREMGVSRRQLSAYINDVKQKNFSAWLSEVRVAYAMRYILENPYHKNAAVADLCGFSSPEYYQRVFRSVTGLTPQQWVEKNAKRDN